MPMMTKLVNINAPIAIRNIKPPIYGVCNNVVMTTGDILKCLCKRAIIDEILPDGSTVRLTMKNYYTDNGAGLDASIHEVKNIEPQPIHTNDPEAIEVPIIENPTPVEEVQTETPVEEAPKTTTTKKKTTKKKTTPVEEPVSTEGTSETRAE